MRQQLGTKKLNRLREQTGLDIIQATARGNTDHSKVLFLRDGSIYYMDRNGDLTPAICATAAQPTGT